jgi:hypothetical protein
LAEFFLAVLFFSGGVAAAEIHPSPLPPNLLRNLHSNRWVVRRDAFEQVVAMQKKAANDPAIRNSLIALLDKEDEEAELGEGAERDLFEDDDYVAYTDQLIGDVQNIAVQTHDQRAWHALVNQRYNQDSRFGNWLAEHREALPQLTQLLHSRHDWQRGVACYVIANMLAKGKAADPFPSSEYKHYKGLIRWHIWHDPPGFVSGFGIRGLGLTKDPEDIPFLEAFASRSRNGYYKKLALQTEQSIQNATSTSTNCTDVPKGSSSGCNSQ